MFGDVYLDVVDVDVAFVGLAGILKMTVSMVEVLICYFKIDLFQQYLRYILCRRRYLIFNKFVSVFHPKLVHFTLGWKLHLALTYFIASHVWLKGEFEIRFVLMNVDLDVVDKQVELFGVWVEFYFKKDLGTVLNNQADVDVVAVWVGIWLRWNVNDA